MDPYISDIYYDNEDGACELFVSSNFSNIELLENQVIINRDGQPLFSTGPEMFFGSDFVDTSVTLDFELDSDCIVVVNSSHYQADGDGETIIGSDQNMSLMVGDIELFISCREMENNPWMYELSVVFRGSGALMVALDNDEYIKVLKSSKDLYETIIIPVFNDIDPIKLSFKSFCVSSRSRSESILE